MPALTPLDTTRLHGIECGLSDIEDELRALSTKPSLNAPLQRAMARYAERLQQMQETLYRIRTKIETAS